jgi:hypothetical protein
VFGALAGGLLAIALLPGSAAAVPPGSLDQSADPSTDSYHFDWAISQTFTAGRSGQLVHAELYCSSAISANVTLTIGSATSLTRACATEGWVDFPFTSIVTVTAGTQYTLDIDCGGTPMYVFEAVSDYAGGQALSYGAPIVGVSDFAFRTYVYGVSTTVVWSVPSVPAGVSTPVTMTTTVQWDAMGLEDFDGVADYGVMNDELPTWFTPTGITCSAPIAPAACTIANFPMGIGSLPINGANATVTVVLTGYAAPTLGDLGIPGQGSAYGMVWAYSADYVLGATSYDADALGVGSAPTAPPTSTSPEPGRSGGGGWLWPVLLAGLLASAAALRSVVVRRVR